MLDFLFELIVEILFEVPIDMSMESKKLKTSVKTVLFSVIGGAITIFLALLTIQKWIAQDDCTGAFFMTLITIVMFFGVIFGAIHGHRHKWKTK